MSLISSSIPNLVNGVSQQPYALRLSSQVESQENGLSTVSSGLRKRPPTEHLAKISSTPLADAFIHTIDRDEAEKYQVIVTNGDLKVYSLAGAAQTVNFTNKPYLDCTGDASDAFALTTVADYTFVVNKTKTVVASTTVGITRPFEALVHVKLGNYGKTYTISINGTVAGTCTTPQGVEATDSSFLATDYIATTLRTSLATAGYTTAPWSVTRYGSVLYIRNTTTDFTVSSEDGFGSNAMVAIKGRLQKFSDLPENPRVHGFRVEIVGEEASEYDNYWVRFAAEGNTSDSSGVWKETVAPGIRIGLDGTTMPHLLVREADGTFTFKPATWANRMAGDLTSNPDPSFVGRKITDIFFFQNRLGFLSDENFIQSETGEYFNVYRTTATALLDSDPIDVTAATNKVAILKHAVGFNKNLLLFSEQQQFLVDSAEVMTPKRVPIKPTTDFAVSTLARPVAAGRNVYFAVDKGKWSSVREFFAEQDTAGNDSTDVTSHIPSYIPSGLVKIASGSNEDVLALLSKEDRSRLYIYKYYFSGTEKLQSSWSRFTFNAGGTILNCDFIRSALYLVVSRADGVYLEKIDFSLGALADGEPYPVHLDRKVQVPTSALTFDGTHTVINPAALGYTPTDGAYMAVAKGGGTIKAGQLLDVTYDGQVKIRGDVTASPLAFGQKYLWRFVLSALTAKKQTPGGGVATITDGRTQVRKIAFNHAGTGYYKVLVTPEARQQYSYLFAGKVLGSVSSEIGAYTLPTGQFSVPVMSLNTRVEIAVESDAPLPAAILSADWEGFYVKRNQSI